MRESLAATEPQAATPIIPLPADHYENWLGEQSESWRRWLKSVDYKPRPNSVCLLPGDDHRLAAVLVGVADTLDTWCLASLPAKLPPGDYRIEAAWSKAEKQHAALGWALACYRYTRYKDVAAPDVRLFPGTDCDHEHLQRELEALGTVRDLINTPAQDMMPEQLAEAVQDAAAAFGAETAETVGEELLQNNYPVIHAVGRASVNAPRLLDLRWGNPAHPKITLVGKGVCFDSGGLDIKSAAGMRLMKKDMGGAAHAIGLARLLMSSGLPVRLRLLVAAVENAVAGNAFRPGDVIRSRQGTTIEIDNTDAEGRLILCDALAEAVGESPELIVDFATLTGAARIALGTDLPAFFCNSDEVAATLSECGTEQHDPIWRLPLHRPYRAQLDSKIADIVNSTSGGYGGAITAALFLQEFVPATTPWVHFDLMAWNRRGLPGRPEGGEAMGLRAVASYLRKRYGGDAS